MSEEGRFDVAVKPTDSCTVVHVQGELDLATAERLEEALDAAPRGTGLVVDLRDCTFVDSTCVRLLVRVVRETQEAGARAALVVTDPGVLRVLEITALDTLVPVETSVEAALAVVAA